MSLSNAVLQKDYALVAVDTRGRLPDGSYAECGKAMLLPHLNAVITIRGFSPRLAALAPYVMAYMGSFDGLLDTFERYVNAAMNDIDRALSSVPPGTLGHVSEESYTGEFTLVGWSESAEKMVGRVFCRTKRGQAVEVGAFQERCIAPHFPDLVFPDIDDDLEALKLVSAEQCRMTYERLGPDYPVGGRLLVFEVRKGGMRTLAEFQLPAPV